MKLSQRTALVTGASRGIGAAIAKRLAAEGARVALTYASGKEAAEALVESIRGQGGEALAIQADNQDPAAVPAAVEATVRAFGSLDILVNNAGIAVLKTLEAITLQDFEKIVAVNVRAVLLGSQAAARHMKAGGRIIHIGSVNAERLHFAGGSLYSMSKAAVVGLMRGMAHDLGPRGITVNTIQPGPTETEMNPATGAFADKARSLTTLGRYAQPEEIAATVAFLAGPEAAYITSAVINVDGGYVG